MMQSPQKQGRALQLIETSAIFFVAIIVSLLLVQTAANAAPKKPGAKPKKPAPKQRVDLSGTITITEKVDHKMQIPEREIDRLVRATWRLPGAVWDLNGRMRSDAKVTLNQYRSITKETTLGPDGNPYTGAIELKPVPGGWLTRDFYRGNRSYVDLEQSALNMRTKTARVGLSFDDASSTILSFQARTTSDPEWRDFDNRPLIYKPLGDPDLYESVFGLGHFYKDKRKISGFLIADTLATRPLFRLKNGWWRAKGTRTIRGFYGDYTPVYFTVKYDLKSKRLSRECVTPPRRLMIGKTAKQAARTARQYGFKTRIQRTPNVIAKRGRVGGYDSGVAGEKRCGTVMLIQIAR